MNSSYTYEYTILYYTIDMIIDRHYEYIQNNIQNLLFFFANESMYVCTNITQFLTVKK